MIPTIELEKCITDIYHIYKNNNAFFYYEFATYFDMDLYSFTLITISQNIHINKFFKYKYFTNTFLASRQEKTKEQIHQASRYYSIEQIDISNSGTIDDSTMIELDNEINFSLKLKELYCNPLITGISLKRFSNLARLDIILNEQLTDDNFGNEKTNYFPLLETLCVGANTNLTNSCLKYLPSLTTLHCGHNNSFSDDGLAFVPNLKRLHCVWNNIITDRGIANVPNLEHLECGHCMYITDDVILQLEKLTCLNYGNLYLTNNQLLQKQSLLYIRHGTPPNDVSIGKCCHEKLFNF